LASTAQALYLLAQRRNLLVEPGDLGLRYRFPLTIGAVELREIPGALLSEATNYDLRERPSLPSLTNVQGFSAHLLESMRSSK
jgi:hypothetical protein